MKAEAAETTRSRARWGLPFVAAVLTFVLTGFAAPATSSPMSLVAGTDFTITGQITDAYPACSGGTGTLYPGTERCLTYTVHNPLNVDITVTSLSTSVDPSSLPADCPASLLDLTGADFSGTLAVPSGGSADVSEPITMSDNGDQDRCQGIDVGLVFSGTAQYTDSATTALASSANPAVIGATVTFTATVTAGNPTLDATGPSGTVDFYSCTDATCTATTLLGSGTLDASGKATFSTTGLPLGTSYITAKYLGSGTDFEPSALSNVVAQSVVAGGGGGGGALLTPPAPPTGSTASSSATSNCTTGNAVATVDGITVTGNCYGALTVALYGSNPVSGTPPFSGGAFFDVKVAPGSSFSTVTIVDSALNGATTLYWWTGTAWVAVNPQTGSAGPPASITAVLSSTSTPTITNLTGTIFAVGTPGTPTTTTTTAPPVGPGGGTTTTTTGPPTAPAGGTTTTTAPPTRAGGGGLAFTGSDTQRLVLSALAMLATGAVLMLVQRRRDRRTTTEAGQS